MQPNQNSNMLFQKMAVLVNFHLPNLFLIFFQYNVVVKDTKISTEVFILKQSDISKKQTKPNQKKKISSGFCLSDTPQIVSPQIGNK